VLPACESYGIGVIPWSPLAGGLLGGAVEKAKEGRRMEEHIQKAFNQNRDRLAKFEGLCRELGEKPADVALAWTLSHRAITSPIIGPRTVEQLEGSLRAVDLTLAPDTVLKLNEIFPGPGGAGPEAWAW
jgi:aryl-alcohol dehydrogenase-like predicted oxidoreductase